MTIQNFEDQYTPPMPMTGIYFGSAEGATWCIIRGEGTNDQALECARKSYGGDWIFPVLSPEKRKTWPSNPKEVEGASVWLLRQA